MHAREPPLLMPINRCKRRLMCKLHSDYLEPRVCAAAAVAPRAMQYDSLSVSRSSIS